MMPGLEPVAALSLACNVMQIVSFGREICSIYHQIKENGTAVPELASKATSLLQIAQQIDGKNNHIPSLSLTQEQRALRNVAQQCVVVATKMSTELEKPNVASQRQVSRLKETFKAHWRMRKMDALEKEMEGLHNILQSRLLHSISVQSEAASLRHSKGFEKLDETFRHFITLYSAGEREFSNILQQLTKTTVQIVTTEGIRTRMELGKELKQFTETTENGSNQNRVIESLQFTGMNERQSQIKDPSTGTFKWIFHANNGKDPLPSFGADWDSLAEWLMLETTNNSNVYWVSGKAGSGKSTLMKYLVESEDTKTMLETLSPHGCLIASYFFNVSGSFLQHSIKGMLCSILRQIFLARPNFVTHPADGFPDLSGKIDESNWSEQQLLTSLKLTISRLDHPICLFVDGLDELDSHDDVLDLLEIIRTLSAFPSAKACVSSRPENIFTQEFHQVPKLKLQNLTKADIRCYVESYLRRFDWLIPKALPHKISSEEQQRLTASISAKSEGVFLWVYIVVRQVGHAILAGDSFELLEKRLDRLPSDLTKLFDQMWSRHNENEELYRAHAASCFNLVISSTSLTGADSYDSEMLPFQGGISLLNFSLGLRQDICASIFDDHDQPDGTYIANACEAAQLQAETRCIGFLEISKNEQRLPLVGVPDELMNSSTCDSSYTRLLEFANTTVNFIHRTAKEYIMHTEQGKAILQRDETTEQRQCFKLFMAGLARSALVISEQPPLFSRLMTKLQALSRSVPQGSLKVLLSRCQLLWQNHRAFWFETGCEEYGNSAAAARCIYHCVYGKQNPWGSVSSDRDLLPMLKLKFPLFHESGRLDFLSWASQYGFSQFVLERIDDAERKRSLPIEYKSSLLQSASNLVLDPSIEITGHCDLICALLNNGADPNLLCPYEQSSDKVEGSRPIETFIYALEDHLLWRKESISDHSTLSATLKKMVERSHLNTLTFTTSPGFSDGRLGITRRTMRQEMLIPRDSTTIYLSVSIRMLLQTLLHGLQRYRPKIADLYLIKGLSEPRIEEIPNIILIAQPRYYPYGTSRRTVSNWVGRLPTMQEYDVFHTSRQNDLQDTNNWLAPSHLPGASKVIDIIEHNNNLDIRDIHKFLIQRGFHEPLDSIESWNRQFSFDRERLALGNPNFRQLTSQIAAIQDLEILHNSYGWPLASDST